MSDLNIKPEKYRHDLEVIRNTSSQMIKDFGMYGVEITFSGNPDSAYRELVSQAEPALEKLFRENRNAFMSLLYRIDIPEKSMNDLMVNEKRPHFFSKLSEMVVEREFLKVLIRKLFSRGNG